jgi:hypothetical protein
MFRNIKSEGYVASFGVKEAEELISRVFAPWIVDLAALRFFERRVL